MNVLTHLRSALVGSALVLGLPMEAPLRSPLPLPDAFGALSNHDRFFPDPSVRQAGLATSLILFGGLGAAGLYALSRLHDQFTYPRKRLAVLEFLAEKSEATMSDISLHLEGQGMSVGLGGTSQPLLSRMEAEGLVAKRWGLPEENGMRLRYWSLTKKGRQMLALSK